MSASTSQPELARASPPIAEGTPRLLRDPAWERTALGPFNRSARARLFAQLRGAVPDDDARPTLRRAYAQVPFYQALFARAAIGLRDLDDARVLDAIPATRRADLAAGIAPFLRHPVDDVDLQRGWLGRTSGSTGQPVGYLRDPRTIAWFYPFVDFALAYARRPPVRAGRRVGILMLDAIAHRPEYDAELPLFHATRFAKRRSDDDDALRATMLSLAPHVVTGDPASLAPLGRLDLPESARPSLVLSSAFAMPRATRAAIASATGAAVLEYYGAQEVGVIAIGCRRGRGLHPLAGACRVDAIDAGEADKELVVTPLRDRAFVLVRYALGDHGALDDGDGRDARDACACGLRGRRIVSLQGRTDVRFVAHDGASFAPGVLNPLLARLPVDEHQLVQNSARSYALRYRAAAALSDASLSELARRLASLARGPASLTGTRVERPLHAVGEKPTPFAHERSAK